MRTAVEVRTRSGDAVLLARLRALDGCGSVHSVFRGVVNLLLPDGELIALAARGRENAPRTLVVEIAHWGHSGVAAGRPVEFRAGGIALPDGAGGLWVDAREAEEWHPIVPSLAAFSPAELGTAARALDRLTRTYGQSGGMLGAAAAAAPMEIAVCAALDRGRAALVKAVRTSDTAGIRAAILALHGLGPGLTPAGDDFLTGIALLSALDGSGLDGYARTLRDVLATHSGRTTLLSTTTLHEALSGRVRAALVDVLNVLAAGRGQSERHLLDTVQNPVRRALAHGHTSGTDTLSGLATGLHLERELRGSL
ncbi:oxamate carbamoyltransferase subunit AllH family protein [Streptomyces boluensis]|uniref:DUF2877 domain-containing protein n=1 Tax=Streptomyces boluensis TaxID=1775135 RepID=A0A964UJR5_9ACTN|nr:DUF2877 domain-containing protein [Streptomyces boluensis]NBE50291.1 DUF2877 domain-containing protein [Streptomyces boluensis]